MDEVECQDRATRRFDGQPCVVGRDGVGAFRGEDERAVDEVVDEGLDCGEDLGV